MDTRFWGPSAWRLLHLQAFALSEGILKKTNVYKQFLLELPFALPCKYCRESLVQYYKEIPLLEAWNNQKGDSVSEDNDSRDRDNDSRDKDNGDSDSRDKDNDSKDNDRDSRDRDSRDSDSDSRDRDSRDSEDNDSRERDSEAISKWLYKIHNKVNKKLKEQNLITRTTSCKDPTYEEVKQKYTSWLHDPLLEKNVLGFDFLKSIAYTTPKSSDPRFHHIVTWWSVFSETLPFPHWQTQWKLAVEQRGNIPLIKGKRATLSWLYKIQAIVNENAIPEQNYKEFTREAIAFSSNCNKGKTCRSKRSNVRRSLRQKRRKSFRQLGGFV
jgi:hypothetical protein